jgi:hypothetical protein
VLKQNGRRRELLNASNRRQLTEQFESLMRLHLLEGGSGVNRPKAARDLPAIAKSACGL